ncbi:MAG: CHAT domain-containing protein, partial [Bacteroidota bacterium]
MAEQKVDKLWLTVYFPAMDELKKELKNLIARNKVKQALQKMADLPEDQKGGQSADIFGLQARLKEHTRNSNMGTIDPMTAGVQKAQIVQGVLALIDDLGSTPVPATPVDSSSSGTTSSSSVSSPSSSSTTILFLAANPKNTDTLRLGEEHRKIDEALIRANHGGKFTLEQGFATTTSRLIDDLLNHSPKILHFSGHGVKKEIEGETQSGGEGERSFLASALAAESESLSYTGGIILEDASGNPKMVEADDLANLVRDIGGIELVFLNACYSEVQATALLEIVPYVIGMNTAVPDSTAIQFASGFY